MAELIKNNDIEFVKDEQNQWQVYRKIRSGKISYSAYTTLLIGIGTTLAVAHKMGRKWIGVEIGKHAETHIITRLQKVISGEDQGGISKAVSWQGGGSFAYYHLGKSIITINKKGEADFNWKLGRLELEKNLLLTYDFQVEELEEAKKKDITLGYKTINQKLVIGICMLSMPDDERDFLNYMEFQSILQIANKKNPAFISVYTNKGIEISELGRMFHMRRFLRRSHNNGKRNCKFIVFS